MGTTPWAAFFSIARNPRIFGPVRNHHQHPEQSMNSTVKSYLYFLAFLAVTKMVVKPIATQMNLPIVKDIV